MQITTSLMIGWPQGLYLALVSVGVLTEVGLHGQPRAGKHNGPVRLFVSAFILGLLVWGGFFGGGQ